MQLGLFCVRQKQVDFENKKRKNMVNYIFIFTEWTRVDK